jgi:hypothetical protein
MARKKKYLNNKDLHDQIVISQEKDKLTREAEAMLMLLAKEANKKLTYSRIEDKEDCIQQARLDLLKYWRGYKPQYKNAFAYYTEISKRGFAKGWNRLYPKKYHGTISLNGGYGSDDNNEGIYSLSSKY